MNKNNFAILILIVAVAAGISYAVGNAVLGSKALKPVTVKTTTPIKAEISEPDVAVFPSDAINPTVQITIGDNTQNPLEN
jgi:hypothetical protein